MVRTRYAPSPTGYMHIGNVKNALNQYLLAKANGGSFVLRIEDTDQKREVEGAVQVIYNTLRALGIKHDEGPDVGGPYGPYTQSERKSLYMEKAMELVGMKKAYYCFCPKERLDTLTMEGTADAVKYDRRCLGLSDDEIRLNLAKGLPFVIRQLIPEGRTTFHDELHGEITIDNSELDDQVLIKSDGFPTYNFANVIDDHMMGITHVIRDERYLSSTPKYNLLYESFGWDIPVYIHNPLLCGEDGKVYSKRRGAQSIDELIAMGFLPEAIVNYVALLGWSPPDNREFFTLPELEQAFAVSGLSKSPSRVDMQKLQWMNGEYFKRMEAGRFHAMAEPVVTETLGKRLPDEASRKLSAALQTRVTFLSEIPGQIDFISAVPDYDTELYVNKKQKTDRVVSLAILEQAAVLLASQSEREWSNDRLYAALQALAADNGRKNSQVLWPVRVALSGKQATPCGATELLELLGRDESLARLRRGIDKLNN